jgi:hypothetical protein
MEYWNGGTLEQWFSLDKLNDLRDKQNMDRRNINRGFEKLRIWQDSISLYSK